MDLIHDAPERTVGDQPGRPPLATRRPLPPDGGGISSWAVACWTASTAKSAAISDTLAPWAALRGTGKRWDDRFWIRAFQNEIAPSQRGFSLSRLWWAHQGSNLGPAD